MKTRAKLAPRPSALANRSLLRTDPTRTATLRRAFAARVNQAFARLRLAVSDLVGREDAVGLALNTRWAFSSDPEKVRAFQDWLKQQFASLIVGRTERELWDEYIRRGFQKGAGRAFDDSAVARRAEEFGGNEPLGFAAGTKEEFLRSAFGAPVAVEKVQLLAGRAFDDLKGVTSDMSLRMSRSLTDSLVLGKGPREAARDLAAQVDIGRDRALVIAQTELIRAHAEGQLTALEQLGVEEVGVAVEWSTTGDGKVCPKCRPLQGVVLTVAEAHGMIPRHPRCRCSFIPANVGESDPSQKRSAPSIRRAIKDSRGGDKGGWGPGEPIAGARPESVVNAAREVGGSCPALDAFSRIFANSFCPTGAGGGIDPSCSPSTSHSSHPISAKSMDWLEEWSFANTVETHKKLTDDMIKEFAGTAPDRPIKVYRAAPLSEVAKPPKEGFRSWTTNKDVAEALVEDGGRVLLTSTIKPHKILVDTNRVAGIEEIGSQGEVIVAYGKSLDHMMNVRSTKKPSRGASE